jgi:hypothetical protein
MMTMITASPFLRDIGILLTKIFELSPETC